MSEWIRDYVLKKSSYFINYNDVREKIEIKCKEIESVCKKYKIQSKIVILDNKAQIMIDNKESDTITWEILEENIILKSKNKEANILLNGMNTYTIMYRKNFERKDTIDKAIDCALQKLLN